MLSLYIALVGRGTPEHFSKILVALQGYVDREVGEEMYERHEK